MSIPGRPRRLWTTARRYRRSLGNLAVLEVLLGMKVEAKELLYTGVNGELLEELVEVVVP